MMRIAVEIHPGGESDGKKTIAEITIGNITGLTEMSDYSVLYRFEDGRTGTAFVFGHARSQGFFPLVCRAVAAIEERLKVGTSTACVLCGESTKLPPTCIECDASGRSRAALQAKGESK